MLMFITFLFSAWEAELENIPQHPLIEKSLVMLKKWHRKSVDDVNLLIRKIKTNLDGGELPKEVAEQIQNLLKKEAKVFKDYVKTLEPTWANYFYDNACDLIKTVKNFFAKTKDTDIPQTEKRQMLAYKFRAMPSLLQKASELDIRSIINTDLTEYEFEEYPICEESKLINQQMTILKVLLLVTWHVLSEKAFNNNDFLPAEQQNWLDVSSVMHIIDTLEPIKGSIFAYEDQQSKNAVLLIHNGYAFGAQRYEKRYGENGKEYGPLDCSSMFEKLLDLEYILTTKIIYLWQENRLEQDLPPRYSRIQPWLNEHLKKVHINGIEDIKPGMIRVVPGHIDLVIASNGSSEILTLSYLRTAKGYDGFGLCTVKYPFEKENTLIFEYH